MTREARHAQLLAERTVAEKARLRSADLLWVLLLLGGPIIGGVTYWLGLSTSHVKVHTDFLTYRDCGRPLLDSAPAGDTDCAHHINHLRLALGSLVATYLFLLAFAAVRVIRESRARHESGSPEHPVT